MERPTVLWPPLSPSNISFRYPDIQKALPLGEAPFMHFLQSMRL